MEEEKTFLETFKEVFEKLKQEGLVKQEDIENGFQIPMVWLASSGIHRDAIIGALRNVYERAYPKNGYPLKKFKRFASLSYSEKDGIPVLEVSDGKRTIAITDDAMQTENWKANVSSESVITEIPKFKKRLKAYELENKFNISREMANSMADCIFDDKQMKSDLYSTPNFLNEMAMNFGEYYRYLQEEKQKRAEIDAAEQEKDKPIETRGGIVEQEPDVFDGQRGPVINPTPDRKSDIYPFEQRDEIFRGLKPKRIVKYDGLDRNRQLVKDAYTLYIYKNPQENNGYLGISEPFDGDKEVRAFFIPENLVEGLQENENIDEFWHTIGEMYISMQRSEFAKENRTYTFKHTGKIESYQQKIKEVIEGIENSSQSTSAKRASLKLFGKHKCREICDGVSRSGYEEAKAAVFEDRQINQTKEGDVRNG